MPMSEIDILTYRLGLPPKKERIENTLYAMQEFVGGPIQCVPLDENLVLVCDEEAKFRNKLPNRFLMFNKSVYDVLCGSFFITRVLGSGDFSCMRDIDIERFQARNFGLYVRDL